MSKGNINVSVENIFPLIKKFLYSDHEIFLRELISNGTDATTKLKHLISIGEAKTELGDAKIEISIDKDAKTLTVKDQGLGMTADEVEKYINQIAFSGAEEFLEKYKDTNNDTGVIGHFGLGFYSAFMVADKVEIITKSFKDAQSYNSLVTLFPMIPGFYIIFNSGAAETWQMFIPVLGPQVLLVDIISGDGLSIVHGALASLVAVALGLLTLYVGVIQLKREAILSHQS